MVATRVYLKTALYAFDSMLKIHIKNVFIAHYFSAAKLKIRDG